MNRRNFLHSLGQSSLVVSALSAVSALATAEENPSTNTDFDINPTAHIEAEVEIAAEISNNHGHELILTMPQYVELIRQTLDETGQLSPVIADIQGLSGHAHELSFSQEELLKLLIVGEIELTSTVGAGHSHNVKISMLVKPVLL